MLFVAYRAMETRAMTAAKDAGYTDITLAQARIGQRIGPEGTRLTDLAERAQVTKQTAGFLVDQLERAGYVERVPDPADGRARLIRLSARGTGSPPSRTPRWPSWSGNGRTTSAPPPIGTCAPRC